MGEAAGGQRPGPQRGVPGGGARLPGASVAAEAERECCLENRFWEGVSPAVMCEPVDGGGWSGFSILVC